MTTSTFFKKGFSPLIATILLMAFSVALVSTVITWKQNLSTFDTGTCSKISFNIETLNDFQLCYKHNFDTVELNFIVKNEGSADIEGMSMLIIGSNTQILQDLDDLIIKQDSLVDVKNAKVEYDLNKNGPIKKIYLTPKIEIDGVIDICPKLFTEAEKIRECS